MGKKDIKKKLEMFKRTQDINSIVEKGSIEGQALLESAGEDRPAEAEHAFDLITKNEMLPAEKRERKEKKVASAKNKRKSKKSKG
ncbi:MAG: hypothetical protein ACP5RK_00585 [Candidatus Micrarchaeia archaeon]